MIAQNLKSQPGFTKVILGESQPAYAPLPALIEQTPERRAVTEWAFTPEEQALIAAGGVLRFTQLCFDQPYHPVQLEVVAAEDRSPLEPVS